MRDAGSGAPLPLPVYNSVGQFRADAWNSLADATGRLRKAAGEAERARLAQQAEEVLGLLDPIEHYWAFPRRHQLLELHELLARGEYDQLRKLAAGITRTLAQSGPGQPKFEVLVVGDMPPDEEEALRQGLLQLRRPEDHFS